VLRTYTRHRPASSKHEHAELLLRSNDRNWLKWRLLPKRDAANGVPISMWLFATFFDVFCDKMPH
jgi:hypothetical protein